MFSAEACTGPVSRCSCSLHTLLRVFVRFETAENWYCGSQCSAQVQSGAVWQLWAWALPYSLARKAAATVSSMAVLLETSKGDLVVDLHTDDCPNTARNFLKLCKCGRLLPWCWARSVGAPDGFRHI